MRSRMIMGNNVDEKFQSLEKILRRFSMRLQKTVVGILPASPIFEFVYEPEPSGVVIRRMFPAPGLVTHSSIYVGSRMKEEGEKPSPTIFNITVNRLDLSSMSQGFEVSDAPLNQNINLAIQKGDMFTVSVHEPEKVKNIWISFLYEVDFRSLGKTEFATEEFLRLMERQEKEEEEEINNSFKI